MTRTRAGIIATASVAALLTLTACSGGDADSEGADPTTDSNATQTPAVEETAPEETPAEEAAPSAARELTADPATGETIEGAGYSFVAPEGWVNQPDAATDPIEVVVSSDEAATEGLVEYISVVRSPAGLVSIPEYEAAVEGELAAAGATEVRIDDSVLIAGAESGHVSADIEQQGMEFFVEQYLPSNAQQTYIVSFNFSGETSAEERVDLAESVMVTWEWTE